MMSRPSGSLSVTIATLAVVSITIRRVDQLAVDLAAERGLGEARTDRRSHLGDRHRLVELTDRTVGKFYVRPYSLRSELTGEKKCGRAALFRNHEKTATTGIVKSACKFAVS